MRLFFLSDYYVPLGKLLYLCIALAFRAGHERYVALLALEGSESARQARGLVKSIPMDHRAEGVLVGRYFIQLHTRGASGIGTD